MTGFGKDVYGINYAKVKFDDGRVAFLKQRRWDTQEGYKRLLEQEYDGDLVAVHAGQRLPRF